MDTYEAHNEAEQPENSPETQSGMECSGGENEKRNRSPFADSPYMMNPEILHDTQEPAGDRPKKKKKGASGRWKGAAAAALAAVLVAGSCGATAAVLNRRWEARMDQMSLGLNEKIQVLQEEVKKGSVSGNPVSSAQDGTVTGAMTPSQVYERCKRSVVAIRNRSSNSTSGSSGSGFILTENGYVVSNHHVVDGGGSLTVTTYDGTEYTAALIGSDETNDVALLKIEAEGLPAVSLGSSDALSVGDQVVAIGNPLGELTSTQTVGYISGKDRSVSTDGTVINMLQTDAAINPGNSGGPLFNMYGQVVGITTAKYSGTTSSGASIEGIGFAIPMDDVTDILDDLKEYGYVTGAYLGVRVRDMNADAAQMYNLPTGAYVETVESGSCAQKGGVRPQDIIIGLGGHEVENINDLTRVLRKFEAGDTVTVTVLRAGQTVSLTLTLDEKPHTAAQPESTQPTQPSLPNEGSFEDWYNYFAPFFGGKN